MKRMATPRAVAIVWVAVLAGCSSVTQQPCPGGERFHDEGETYCIIRMPDSSDPPDCPDSFPYDTRGKSIVACADHEMENEEARRVATRARYLFDPGPCPGGEELDVDGERVCLWSDENHPEYFLCPDGGEPESMSYGTLFCGPDDVSEGEVRQAAGLHCAALNATREECESGTGCWYVRPENRAFIRDGQCDYPDEGRCLFVAYTGNNDIFTCAYRTEDGVPEAFEWPTGTVPPGWEWANFEEPPEVCRCLDEYTPVDSD